MKDVNSDFSLLLFLLIYVKYQQILGDEGWKLENVGYDTSEGSPFPNGVVHDGPKVTRNLLI